MKKDGYVNNVDELIADTPLDQVLVHYGLPPSDRTSGEYRINCVFNPECSESSYGNLAIGVSHPAKQIYCHVCSTRGNLLTLIHGLETHAPPAPGKLRGAEFKAALNKLKEIRDGQCATKKPADPKTNTSPGARSAPDTKPPLKRNVPLSRHENEAARKLADLHEDLVTDPAKMSPAAAQYVRAREWMTPEVMHKWGVGQGRRAINAGDVEALQAVDRQLFAMLPSEEQAKVRGFGGGTIR